MKFLQSLAQHFAGKPIDWDELEGIVEDAFASVAPKNLLPD